MPGVDIEQVCSRHKAGTGSTAGCNPLTARAHSSELMEYSDGFRISGKKRKRNRRKQPRNRRDTCKDSDLGAVPDRERSSGLPTPLLKTGLPNGDVDASIDGFICECPALGASSSVEKAVKKKKTRQSRFERMWYPQASELASPSVSAELEKESLRAWVEMGLKRQDCSTSRQQDGVAAGGVNGHRDCTIAEKRFGKEEARVFENGINGMVEHLYQSEKVRQYVTKRCVVVRDSPMSSRARTVRAEVSAWGRIICVTITTEAAAVQGWICRQNGCLFGLDVEWRPNRMRGEENKVALLQLCSENECLIVQLLFLGSIPEALREFLFNPLKKLAGVGIYADSRRLLRDYGLVCQGEVELTILAAERMKREELKHTGLKALVSKVLGLNMKKSKRTTLSDWSRLNLTPPQVEYACIDAWVSLALAQKLMAESL